MTLAKGRAVVLRAMADARAPEIHDPLARARDFKAIFLDHPNGPRCLTWLMEMCGMHEAVSEPHARTMPDLGNSLIYREGRRSIGVEVQALLTLAFMDQPKVPDDDRNDLNRR
jgi:hypothetical protein